MRRWREKAKWNSSIAHLSRIHPNLFIGSRLTVQRILNNQAIRDQFGKYHRPSDFFLLCVAGNSVCSYSKCYKKSHSFYMRDRVYDDCEEMIKSTMHIAKDLYNLLSSGKKVLIHCHAGQNRAAFCVSIMAAKYNMVPTLDEFMKIMQEWGIGKEKVGGV
jgi:hypothetical protein